MAIGFYVILLSSNMLFPLTLRPFPVAARLRMGCFDKHKIVLLIFGQVKRGKRNEGKGTSENIPYHKQYFSSQRQDLARIPRYPKLQTETSLY